MPLATHDNIKDVERCPVFPSPLCKIAVPVDFDPVSHAAEHNVPVLHDRHTRWKRTANG